MRIAKDQDEANKSQHEAAARLANEASQLMEYKHSLELEVVTCGECTVKGKLGCQRNCKGCKGRKENVKKGREKRRGRLRDMFNASANFFKE